MLSAALLGLTTHTLALALHLATLLLQPPALLLQPLSLLLHLALLRLQLGLVRSLARLLRLPLALLLRLRLGLLAPQQLGGSALLLGPPHALLHAACGLGSLARSLCHLSALRCRRRLLPLPLLQQASLPLGACLRFGRLARSLGQLPLLRLLLRLQLRLLGQGGSLGTRQLLLRIQASLLLGLQHIRTAAVGGRRRCLCGTLLSGERQTGGTCLSLRIHTGHCATLRRCVRLLLIGLAQAEPDLLFGGATQLLGLATTALLLGLACCTLRRRQRVGRTGTVTLGRREHALQLGHHHVGLVDGGCGRWRTALLLGGAITAAAHLGSEALELRERIHYRASRRVRLLSRVQVGGQLLQFVEHVAARVLRLLLRVV
mmetsp:Transcript_8249/g.20776  ORF Transcript_8249/g.20776 Transcript_8249/m.20776 type:complete len:374 (+) Transcript_8249:3218-4339(+)